MSINNTHTPHMPHPEDEYFAELDREQLKKIASELRQHMAAEEAERLRVLHDNHCAACGFEMKRITFHGLNLQRCFHCGGAFFRRQDFEALGQLLGEEPRLMDRVADLFKF